MSNTWTTHSKSATGANAPHIIHVKHAHYMSSILQERNKCTSSHRSLPCTHKHVKQTMLTHVQAQGSSPYLRNAIKPPKNLESRRNPRNVPQTPRSNSPFPARSAATARITTFPRAPADRQNSRRSSRVKVGEEERKEKGKNRARVCLKNTGASG
ncbi:hypothetical protein Taro_039969 [Colocasia esculenta]|uniref:Uncharacterized protein n=1 Tax=Colocasia esculenta TaxID=4460 RepID=A0A843WRP2_COLES|nr:hypothetical protein [Colocasia esculenta]